MSPVLIKTGAGIVALICAATGLGTIVYGYLAIYSLSGFSSIFFGVAILIIAFGLMKRHAVARIGAYIVLIVSSTGCLLWLFFYQHEIGSTTNNFGMIEYFCLVYIFLSLVAILFLSLPSIKEYFSVTR